jgi:uncharacterized NAD(P)/FAD-binding protein YdhS
MSPLFDAAIIGGGFSGLATALHLQRRHGDARIAWIRGRIPGFGLAYRTPDPGHVLNVRAERMSAWSESGDDFVRWLQRRHPGRYAASDFVPRAVYAQYLGDLEQQLTHHVHVLNADAVAARHDRGWSIRLDSGESVAARHCVLATGNPGIRQLDWPERPNLVRDFWGWRLQPDWQLPDLPARGRVVIVGSGLSAVDAGISVIDGGFAGDIMMISASGALPHLHAPVQSAPGVDANAALRLQPTARHYLHAVRALADEHDWRHIVDSLRCHTTELWRALPEQEQRRFMRHVASWWNIHRHRMAPEVHARLRASAGFSVHRGRVLSVDANGELRWRRGGHTSIDTLHADLVINCTGPAYAPGLLDSELMRDLLRQQLVQAHPLGLGIQTPQIPGLHVIGPLLLGERFETTAVPELRQQADAIAMSICQSLAAIR